MTDDMESSVHRWMLDESSALEIAEPDVDRFHRRADQIMARRGRTTVAAVVVAVVTVMGVAADVTVHLSGRPSSTPAGASRATSGIESPATNPAVTAQADVKIALDAFTLPTGAHVLATSPSVLLVPSTVSPATGHVAEEVRWWTVKGTLSDVLAFMQANPPPGLAPVQGAVTNTGAQFFEYASVPPGKALRVIMHLGAVQIGEEVGLEIDAHELWGAP